MELNVSMLRINTFMVEFCKKIVGGRGEVSIFDIARPHFILG